MSHAQTWQLIQQKLEKERSDKIDALIRAEDAGARAVIQFIDEIIERFPRELASNKD